jgi:hypothetical protein
MKATLDDVLSESEQLLLIEALHRLRELKREALQTVRAAGLRPGGRAFEERDFGIPQIDSLLSKLGEDFDVSPA